MVDAAEEEGVPTCQGGARLRVSVSISSQVIRESLEAGGLLEVR